MKSKYYYYIALGFLLGVGVGSIIGVVSVISFQKEYEEEFELTDAMRTYRDKLDEKGYLTEEDLKEMRIIQQKYD